MMHDDLSFLPQDYLQRKVRRHTLWIGSALLVGVVATIALLTFRAASALRTAEKTHAEIQRGYDVATGQFNQLCQQRDAQRKIIQRAALASTLIERVPRSILLAELTNRLPEGASLMDITLESHPRIEPTVTATTPFDMKKAAIIARQKAESFSMPDNYATEVGVKISGLADTDVEVAHYLSELGHSPLFRDVSLVISEAYSLPGHSGKTVRRFQIQTTVNADARLMPRPESSAPVTANVSE